MEKIDIPQTYSEINDAIKNEDHEKILLLSEKILKVDAKESEAFQCKILALVNLSRNDEIQTIVEKSSMQKELLLEYAYSLHEKKKYLESINVLDKYSSLRKDLMPSINELLAQNYYKLGQFNESFRIFKELIDIKIKNSADLDEERDLISNYLAAYIFSNINDESLLLPIMKYLNSWESFYNYCIICLKQGKFNESMELLNRIKRDFSQAADESSDFNEVKNLNLNLTICQTALDGFDHSKVSRITESYETFFNSGKFQELFPYFYNNFLNIKKDKEPINDILRKLDNILKNENLMQEERDIVLLNKTILLLRANRIAEASEIYKNMNPDANSTGNNPLRTIVYCYIYLKQEKAEKYDEFVKSDISIKNKPESHLILIQIMLSSLTSKNMEQFHLKVLNFIKEFFEYTINFHFLNFFIGFYESRHLKDYLKEFVRNYKDTSLVYKSLISKRKEKDLKKCFILLGRSLYTVGLYEESSSYFSYLLENVDKYDVLLKIELINSIAHLNAMKSEEIRRQIDDTMIDMSLDHFNVLVSEVFAKSKKNQGGDKKKCKKNKKKRFPKNFDPKKPGPMPDVERWLPRMQRKKFRNVAKNKLAYQGATADNTVTSSQFGKK